MTSRIDDGWQYAGLVPPRRLGTLLANARSASGQTLEQLAESAPEGLGLSRLASIELGSVELDDDELASVAALYGVDATSVVPPRSALEIDLDEGILRVDGRRSSTEIGEGADRHQVLSRYLALVYSMRQIEPGDKLTLRTADLEVLGKALRVGTTTLTTDLDVLMSNPGDVVGWRHRLLRRKVLIPAAGVLVTFCGAAALVMVPGAGADDQSVDAPATEVTAVEPRVGTAIVQERNPDGTPGPEQIRGGATEVGIGTVTEATVVDAAGLER